MMTSNYNTAWLMTACTIKKIDTGEKLDIVYITDSLMDGCTSMVIAKDDNEYPCDGYQLPGVN